MPRSPSIPLSIRYLAAFCTLGGFATASLALPITESFDGWIKDGYDSGPLVYSNQASGVWSTFNAVVRSESARSGRAVRFRDSGATPYLIYSGLSGQGLNGGIASISFYYRHWDADGRSVRFQLQAGVNGANWTNLGPEVNVTSTNYLLHEWNGLLLDDNLHLRVLSTAFTERLLIDDFTIIPFSGPRLNLQTNLLIQPESAGLIHHPVWVDPPAEASADLTQIGGDAIPGEDFTLLTTQLVFTVDAPTQTIAIAILDNNLPQPNRTAHFAFTNLTGLILGSDSATLTLIIEDEDRPTATITPSSIALPENAPPLTLDINLSIPADATVHVARAGTALPGLDVHLSTTTLVFSADGPSTLPLVVTPIDNSIGDGDRTLILTLDPLYGANPGQSTTSLITILDDEPFANFTATDLWVDEGQTGVILHVTLSSPSDATVHLQPHGEAIPGQDYLLSTTTLAFSADGPLTQSVSIDILNDGLAEGPERARFTLTGNLGFRPGANATFHLGIRDADSLTLASANLTSGGGQTYETPGRRILRSLMPDVIAIQEFRVSSGSRRAFVDEVFGTNYHFVVEAGVTLPGGIVSRWPILDWGIWPDPVVGNRNFVWATIDLPNGQPLHVAGVHFLASGSAADRNQQAQNLASQIQAHFNPSDFIVVAGDLNTQNRSEQALITLGQIVSDARQPADQNTNPNTNRGRNRPYDFVLPNPSLEEHHIPLRIGTHTFTQGLVFDTRLWSDPPHPSLPSDSDATDMQHMAVLKTFAFPTGLSVRVHNVLLTDLGNADGQIDPGETHAARFVIDVRGTETATQIVLSVASPSPYLTIDPPYTESLGTHPPGTVITTQTDAVFLIAPDAPYDPIPYHFILSANGITWTQHAELAIFDNRFALAIDAPHLPWQATGIWNYQTNITYDGLHAALNTGVPPAGTNSLRTQLEGPGMLTFAWWLGQNSWELGTYLRLRVNGSTWLIHYTTGWKTEAIELPPGTHTIEWQHYNSQPSSSPARAALDQIHFIPYDQPLLLVTPNHLTQTTTLGPAQFTRTLAARNPQGTPYDLSVAPSTPWIATPPDPVSLNAFDTSVPLTLLLDDLSPGTYTGNLILTPSLPSIPAQTATVTLVIGPAIEPPHPQTWSWVGGGQGLWFTQTNTIRQHPHALQSGPITHDQESWLAASVAGPGTLSFWWRVSSEANYDFLTLYKNGQFIQQISGNTTWLPVTLTLEPGTHSLVWVYAKDEIVTAGQDTAWLADFTYTGNPDRDADGLPDAWEILHFGSPTGATPHLDTDSDGWTNWEEYIADTNPNDLHSNPDRLIHLTPTHLHIPTATTARHYRIDITTSLAPGPIHWTTALTNQPGTPHGLTFPLPPPTTNPTFIRTGISLP